MKKGIEKNNERKANKHIQQRENKKSTYLGVCQKFRVFLIPNITDLIRTFHAIQRLTYSLSGDRHS